jgi:hypothetical protein
MGRDYFHIDEVSDVSPELVARLTADDRRAARCVTVWSGRTLADVVAEVCGVTS